MINKIKKLIQQDGQERELLFLTKFGSKLYGTDTVDSDDDYRGIFLPTMQDLVMANPPQHFVSSTGNGTDKNTSEDIDVTMYSLQKYINILKDGDTGALDMFFSPSNPTSVIYMSSKIEPLFNNISKVLNLATSKSYVGYCISQAKKFGIKGSRLGIISGIKELLEANEYNKKEMLLGNIVSDIVLKFGHESYCFLKDIASTEKECSHLFVCGARHQLNITLEEFYNRMCKEESKFGWRTRESSNGIDWKALSHAVRVAMQSRQLYEEGQVTFPLYGREMILQVKQGEFDFEYVSNLILDGLEEVEKAKQNSVHCGSYKYNHKFVVDFVMSLYN